MNDNLQALHAEINHLIEAELQSNPVSYNKQVPYQSYERIEYQGLRWSVEKRIREYGLEKYYDPSYRVLDIGSNFGFFVCEFALHCSAAHGVEPNPHLIQIGEAAARHLNVAKKTEFFDCLFEDFKPPHNYDIVFSLAAFHTADGRERTDARNYFGKINDMLSDNGQLFYESTSYTRAPDSDSYANFRATESAVEAIHDIFTDIDEWETPSGSDGYFRRFAASRKAGKEMP